MAFPSLLLALAVVAALGTGVRNTVVALDITFAPLIARMVRASVLTVASEARSNLQTAWWMAVGPGTALIVLILSINALGDGFRYIFDPRLRL